MKKSEDLPSAPVPDIQVNWITGKDMIRSGDIISFFSSHEESALHRVTTESIQFFTGSKIFHTGIAVWMVPEETNTRRLMLCEAVGVGRRIVNMNRFRENKMEVHHLPEGYSRKAVVDFMINGIGTSYAFWNLAAIGIKEFFGYLPKTQTKAQVCSETAARAWEAAGFKFESTTMSPGRLRNYLGANGVPPSLLINPEAGG